MALSLFIILVGILMVYLLKMLCKKLVFQEEINLLLNLEIYVWNMLINKLKDKRLVLKDLVF